LDLLQVAIRRNHLEAFPLRGWIQCFEGFLKVFQGFATMMKRIHRQESIQGDYWETRRLDFG
jgi:hypothetical protein